MARICVFCGGTPLSEEHAIPQWVSELLPGEGPYTHRRAGANAEIRTWRHPTLLQLTIRRTCVKCNSEWMSNVESSSRDLIARVMLGNTADWDREAQTVVATWAYKTALMLDFVGVHRTIPAEHYSEFYETRVPVRSCRIWATSYAPAGDDEFQSAWFNGHGLTLHLADRNRRAYTMTFNVGYVVFQIFGFEGEDDLTVEKRRFTDSGKRGEHFLIPIWPVRDDRVTWPPTFAFDARGLGLLAEPSFG